jgi:hypothetical protein
VEGVDCGVPSEGKGGSDKKGKKSQVKIAI